MMVNAHDATLANWICAVFSIIILSVRLAITRYRDKAFDIASIAVAASILVVGTRIGVVYLYLEYGTASDAIHNHKTYFNHDDLKKIKTGSILALASRLMITTFYWLQISILLLFYSIIVREMHWIHTIRVCWCVIGITYIAVALSTFLECHPFHLYYQIHPNPGQCVRAYVQLFMQGISNIILDLLLLAISIPILKVHNRTWPEKLRVGGLFVLGFFTIIVTTLRIAYIVGAGSSQPVRSFWASVQMLTSCFVANAPTVYGCYQVIRKRKSDQLLRRASRPEIWRRGDSIPSQREEHSQSPEPLDFITTTETRQEEVVLGREKAWSRHVP